MLPLLLVLCAAPNVVILLADDLGYGDLGCFGHKEIRTPHLDKLAKEGLRLTSCYASAPVCSPSRAGMLTGQHPYRHGIRDWIPAGSGIHLPKNAPSIARLLAGKAYRTCHVGKWHLNSRMDGKEPTPGDMGYQRWLATQNNAAPSHLGPDNFVRDGKPVGRMKGDSSRLLADEAVAWMASVKDAPFLLSVWFHAPHEPVAVPDDWARRHPKVDDPARRQYLACVELLDEAVGRIMAKVPADTLVLFTSDNGPETLKRYRGAERSHGSPGALRGMKLHLTEGGIRVPGILWQPGRIKPGTSDVPVSNIDMLPTLCELAGAKPTAALDGTSLVPLLDGKPLMREKPLYWRYDKALGGYKHALRDGKWKLLARDRMAEPALFDLDADPGEKNDLAATAPARLKAMLAAMRERDAEIVK